MPIEPPHDPNRIDARRPLVEDRSRMSTIGILGALAFAVVLGLVFWSMADNNTTASNNSPGVTTGASTTPVAPPSNGTSNAPAKTGTPSAPASR
jgi:hypothetical protein